MLSIDSKKVSLEEEEDLSLSDDSMSAIVSNIDHFNTHNLPENLIKGKIGELILDLYLMIKMTTAMIYKLDSAGDNLKAILTR